MSAYVAATDWIVGASASILQTEYETPLARKLG
jgi:hypothetical protein